MGGKEAIVDGFDSIVQIAHNGQIAFVAASTASARCNGSG